ncbi:hypothetical protein I4200191B4_25150 [Pseudoflavonifractor gallinarum]
MINAAIATRRKGQKTTMPLMIRAIRPKIKEKKAPKIENIIVKSVNTQSSPLKHFVSTIMLYALL